MLPIAKQFLPALKRGAIVTDVGSVKAGVVRELEPLIAKAGGHFIGSHPMAGAEKTGVAAAREDLFENAACVLTPTKNSSVIAIRKLEKFWKSLGGWTLWFGAAKHDLIVSRSSHLPHVVAAALAELGKFQSALKSDDAKAIEKIFTTAKQRRDNWCAKAASISSE